MIYRYIIIQQFLFSNDMKYEHILSNGHILQKNTNILYLNFLDIIIYF